MSLVLILSILLIGSSFLAIVFNKKIEKSVLK